MTGGIVESADPPSCRVGDRMSAHRGMVEGGLRRITIRPGCPGSRRILVHGSQEYPAERGPLGHGPRPRRPLKVVRNAAQQVDAARRHTREPAARHGTALRRGNRFETHHAFLLDGTHHSPPLSHPGLSSPLVAISVDLRYII